MTDTLYSTQDLVKLTGNAMVSVDITRQLTKQGHKPVHTYKAGKGEVRLWAADAKDALLKYRADLKAQQAEIAARKAKPAPVPAEQVTTTNEAPAWARALATDMSDHHGANVALMESVRLCHAQNAALLKAIERIGIDLSAKIAALQESVDTPMVADLHIPETLQHKPVLTLAPPVVPLRKIAIIGLLAAQKQVIEREFSQAFDIRFYETDDAKGRAFSDAVSRCEAAFLMISFINHSIESAVKATGTRIIKATGGMSSLRDKLTELYVTPAPAKAQA